jgi:DNA polymerase-3 subunit epsilon
MPDFKLKTVAKEVGLVIDESKLHDAVYDVMLTRDIYKLITEELW